jgi:hypothetical protein
MAPQESALPGTRTTKGRFMATNILPNAPDKVARELGLLEERLRHELMDDAERQELRDRIIHIRRRLNFGLSR